VNVNGTGDTTPVNGTPVSSTPTAPTSTSVAVAGLTSVGEQMIASYVFVDPNGDSEATSTYRWLSSDTAGGTYSPVVGATSINYTITSGDAGKYLKFEVTPVSNTSPTTGSPVLSSASSQVTETTLNHILSTGQSLSLGSKGGPALSTTQPYNNKMLNGSSLTALVESTLESMSSAMANTLTALSPNTDFQSAVTRHGAGSKSYTQLKKGTTLYADGLTQATNVKNAATALGLVAKVIAVTNIHGESDHVADNGADYQSYLEEWHSDYNTDVKVITGQTGDIPMITDQMSSQTGYDDATSLIPLAQLSASEDNPGDIILVGPKYYFTYADNAHLENTSYRWLGEYYGKVLKKVTLDNESWKPLSPDSITRSGNVIYADFHVPAGEIAFDTTLVSARTHYGFEYYDDTSSASISSVEILDDDTVKVTLSGTPTGADQRLRYAYTGVPGTQPGAQNTGSAAGNLRDTDSTPSLYGNTLYNWSVHFDKSITEDSVAPTPSSILSNPSNTTTDITWTTNEAGATIVDYGLTNSYGTSTTETNTSSRVLNHNVTLPSLFACTTYHYRVRSKDAAQNQGASTNKTFTTAGCTGGSEVTSESATSITGATGGTSTLSEISLNIPGGATGDAVYQIKALNKSTVLGSAGSPTGRTTVGNSVFDLKALTGTGTATTSFSNPIEVTLSYQDGDVIDMEESSLVIYRYDGTDWYSLAPCTVDTNLNTVTCSTSNFSVFGLFGTPPVSSGSSGSRSSSAKAQLAFAEYYAQKNAEATPTPDTQNTCSANQTLTQNLRAPSRNGVFNSYTQGIVTEAAILQGHLNRLGFNSGPEDGIIGPLTEGAIKRMQTFLGTIPDGYVGPITRGLLNESCGEGGLIS
jgi:hypothetical protein